MGTRRLAHWRGLPKNKAYQGAIEPHIGRYSSTRRRVAETFNVTVRLKPMDKKHPTPEQVLAVIIDEHRHAGRLDPEVDTAAVLSSASTVEDWRGACDLVGWRSLGHALNSTWGMDVKDEEWEAVLEPSESRTLMDLCELIACNATVVRMPATGLLGGRCPENRGFRAIRTVLLSLGVRRELIRPETPLTPLLSHYGWRLLDPLVKLAPGALPPVHHAAGIARPLQGLAGISLLAGIILSFKGSAYTLFCVAAFAALFAASYAFRGRLELEGITTLADLAGRLGRSEMETKTQGEPATAPYSEAAARSPQG